MNQLLNKKELKSQGGEVPEDWNSFSRKRIHRPPQILFYGEKGSSEKFLKKNEDEADKLLLNLGSFAQSANHDHLVPIIKAYPRGNFPVSGTVGGHQVDTQLLSFLSSATHRMMPTATWPLPSQSPLRRFRRPGPDVSSPVRF